MPTPTIDISKAAQQILQELAEQTGMTTLDIIDKALDDYRRKVFFAGLAEDFAALKADPEAWAEELAERQLWETTLMDGQDLEERWDAEGRPLDPSPPQEETT